MRTEINGQVCPANSLRLACAHKEACAKSVSLKNAVVAEKKRILFSEEIDGDSDDPEVPDDTRYFQVESKRGAQTQFRS